MLCRSPFVRDRHGKVFSTKNVVEFYKGIPFGCGKCLACRVKKRREWTTRLICEALQHKKALFLTLTYDEEHVPWTPDGSSRTLSLRDLQLFIKRLRKYVDKELLGRKFRFFAAGEYGRHGTMRPHYHLIIFGLSDTELKVLQGIDSCWRDPVTHKSFGMWKCDPCTDKTVAYVAGYVTKKLISPVKVYKTKPTGEFFIDKSTGECEPIYKRYLSIKDSQYDADGVRQEFRVMSRRPGLGYDMLKSFYELFLTSTEFRRVLSVGGDVPSYVRCMGRTLFLDRYLKTKLREMLGIVFDPTAYYEEMRASFVFWDALPDDGTKDEYFFQYLVHQDDQKYRQLEERVKQQLQKRGML